jgi:hypothetical protein
MCIIAVICLYLPSEAQELEVVGSCSLPYFYGATCRGIYVDEDYAFLAKTGAGFIIVNIQDSGNPYITAVCDTVYVDDVVVQKNLAYLAAWGHGIILFDVSNPNSPILLGSLDIFGDSHGIFVKGDLAYLAHCEHDLTIFNVVDPRNPSMIYWFPIPFHFSYDVKIIGYYAYVLDRNQGLTIIDVSNPLEPFICGTWDDVDVTHRFSILNSIAYVTTRSYEISIVDVSDAYNPSLITEYDLDTLWTCDVVAKNNNIFIAGSELVIMDVSDPANPFKLVESDFDIIFHSISVKNDLIYLAGSQWFYIVRYSSSTSVESPTELPEQSSILNTSPNPFNSSTSISFNLNEPGLVNLSVYNIQGQRVAVLFNGIRQAGEHSIAWNASGYPSGVYFARLEAGGSSRTAKMVLLK